MTFDNIDEIILKIKTIVILQFISHKHFLSVKTAFYLNVDLYKLLQSYRALPNSSVRNMVAAVGYESTPPISHMLW